MPGWGRRIAGRKLEDDELFQQIGGQLEAVQFDYTKWQRSSSSKQEQAPLADEFTVAAGAKSSKQSKPAAQPGLVSAKALAQKKEQDAQRAERIKMLRLKIIAHQKTLAECEERVRDLTKANRRLMSEIQQCESGNHATVEKLLRQYDRYQGSMLTMKDHFAGNLNTAQQDLEQTKIRTANELSVLQKKVDDVDAQLIQAQEEFSLLSGYKDKEYPTKMLRILELQRELEAGEFDYKEAERELSNIINAELEKMSKSGIMDEVTIRQKAAKDVIESCPKALVDMALQNRAMERDIQKQEVECAQLERTVTQLTENIQVLLRNPKTDVKQQLFPQFYSSQAICTPDSDVVLDIPVKEWLPI